MKCPYCDQEHPDGSVFCPNTGKQIQQPGQQMPADLKVPSQAMEDKPILDSTPVQLNNLVDNAQTSSPQSEVLQETAIQLPNQPKKPARHLLPKIALGCIGIPVFLILILLLLIFIDPFRLHVWGRIDGSYDAAAEMMPADTSLYLGVNLGNALLTRIDRIWAPFIPTSQSPSGFNYLRAFPGNQQQTTPFEGLFQQILRDTGIKVPDDLTPWIGQYGGIGISKFDDSQYGTSVPSGWMLAIEARDSFRADAFLSTLVNNISDIRDTTFTPQTYHGAHIFVQVVASGQKALSFGRSGRMVLLATDYSILKDAIDGRGKQALSAQDNFNNLINHRPRNWSASLYLDPKLFTNFAGEVMQVAGGSPETSLILPYSLNNLSGMLINATAINGSLRIDATSNYDLSSQSATVVEDLQSMYSAPTEVTRVLPEDTVIFLANSRFDLFMQTLMRTAFTNEAEKSAFFNDFETLFGFSLQEDLVNHLNGQWALYVVPSKNGILPQQANLNLAISLLAQTDDHLDLPGITDKIKIWGPLNGINIKTQQVAGITYYMLNPGGEFPADAVTFSQNKGFFTFGTDANILQSTFAQETSLINLASYKNAVAMLPSGMQPSIYIDLQRLIADIREGMSAEELQSFNETIGIFQHVRVIASANQMKQPGVLESSMIILLSDN